MDYISDLAQSYLEALASIGQDEEKPPQSNDDEADDPSAEEGRTPSWVLGATDHPDFGWDAADDISQYAPHTQEAFAKSQGFDSYSDMEAYEADDDEAGI